MADSDAFARLDALEREMRCLRDLEDIKRVKHRYFRAMTFNDYDLLKGTLTEDVMKAPAWAVSRDP